MALTKANGPTAHHLDLEQHSMEKKLGEIQFPVFILSVLSIRADAEADLHRVALRSSR